jgi:hypothetical protein
MQRPLILNSGGRFPKQSTTVSAVANLHKRHSARRRAAILGSTRVSIIRSRTGGAMESLVSTIVRKSGNRIAAASSSEFKSAAPPP